MTEAAANGGPLQGLHVLDLATFVSASFSATLLGDFGADVIKVERPGSGDPQRALGGARVDDGEITSWWATVARNKRSVELDLGEPASRPAFERLVAWADVLVENFRPGTLEGWDWGTERLHELNPELTILRISGFGQTGPDAERAAFERAAQAFSGVMYVTGEPNQPPQRIGVPVCDYASGLWGAFGIVLALLDRAQQPDRGGQVIDHAIYASLLPMLRDIPSVYELTGEIAERSGNRSAVSAPGEARLTSDGRWVFVAATGDRVFARAMAAIERPELATDPRFATSAGRLRERAVLDRALSEWVGAHAHAAVLERMRSHGVPASTVNSIAELVADEQVVARGDFERHASHDGDPVLMPAVLPRLSLTPGSIRQLGPRLGEHTDEVLAELGLNEEEDA